MDNQVSAYRDTFSTPNGKRVLGHILLEAGYFDVDLVSPEDIAVQNFAKKIIRNLGIITLKNVDSYVSGLFNLPVDFKETSNE